MYTEKERIGEIVIVEDNHCMKAHRDLFRMSEDCYRRQPRDTYTTVNTYCEYGPYRVHLVGTWTWLLSLAFLRDSPPDNFEVLYLLKQLGVEESLLQAFRESRIEDIYYTLYYGRRLDVLRRLCHYTRWRLQEAIKTGTRFECHIVSYDRPQIIASSL